MGPHSQFAFSNVLDLLAERFNVEVVEEDEESNSAKNVDEETGLDDGTAGQRCDDHHKENDEDELHLQRNDTISGRTDVQDLLNCF